MTGKGANRCTLLQACLVLSAGSYTTASAGLGSAVQSGTTALEGWAYSRTVTISPSTPYASYQINITLNESFTYSHAASGGSDFRFMAGATPLNYWIEKWRTGSPETSIIWVQVPAVGTSSITMHYGNPAVPAASNGYTTFIFFDDFNSGLNLSRWDVFNDGSGGIGTDVLNVLNGYLWINDTNNSWRGLNSMAAFKR